MKKHLKAMGYRNLQNDIWAKPVGYHLFSFNMSNNEFLNLFKALNKEVMIWHSAKFEDEEDKFLDFLKSEEANSKINANPSLQTNFEFLTTIENIIDEL